MTRPIDCQVSDPHFTILQILYYISALASAHGHLIETDANGQPVPIELANSKYPHAAPSHSGSQTGFQQPPASPTFIYPLPSNSQYHLVSCNFYHGVVLEPWVQENCCGGKCFRGLLMPDGITVIFKLWDGYKSDGGERDKEVQIYMLLQHLWGNQIPQFICSADICFCYGMVLEDVKVRHCLFITVSWYREAIFPMPIQTILLERRLQRRTRRCINNGFSTVTYEEKMF